MYQVPQYTIAIRRVSGQICFYLLHILHMGLYCTHGAVQMMGQGKQLSIENRQILAVFDLILPVPSLILLKFGDSTSISAQF